MIPKPLVVIKKNKPRLVWICPICHSDTLIADYDPQLKKVVLVCVRCGSRIIAGDSL